jgi:hypothetical protein
MVKMQTLSQFISLGQRMKLDDVTRMDKSRRVEQASIQCCNLLESFAEQDPLDPNSAWKNPQEIFDQLDTARNEVMEAWKEDEQGVSKELDEAQFRILYMDMITDAFADVLDNIRESEGNQLDVDVLVDCLQSGIDLLSMQDKDLFMNFYEGNLDELEEFSSSLTPHEQKRRELGFADDSD